MGVRSKGARVKGYIRDLVTDEIKYFMFNPTAFSESVTVNYSTISGVGSAYPMLEFGSGSANSIPLEIYLRGTPDEVKSWVKWLKSFVPAKSTRTTFEPPHLLRLALGDYSADCVMSAITVKYTEFDESLKAIEATVSVTLIEVVV